MQGSDRVREEELLLYCSKLRPTPSTRARLYPTHPLPSILHTALSRAATTVGRLAPGSAVGRGRSTPSVDGAARRGSSQQEKATRLRPDPPIAKGATGAGIAVGSTARAVVGDLRSRDAGTILGLAPTTTVRARRAAPTG